MKGEDRDIGNGGRKANRDDCQQQRQPRHEGRRRGTGEGAVADGNAGVQRGDSSLSSGKTLEDVSELTSAIEDTRGCNLRRRRRNRDGFP